MRAGLLPSQFWEMTPRELAEYYQGKIWQEEQEQRKLISLAWYTAALGRARRLPTLRRLIEPKPKGLTPEQLQARKAEIDELSQRMGKGLRYAGEGRG